MTRNIAEINKWVDDRIMDFVNVDPKNIEQVDRLRMIILEASNLVSHLQNSLRTLFDGEDSAAMAATVTCWRRVMGLLLIDWYPKYDSILKEHYPSLYHVDMMEAHREMQSRFLKYQLNILRERPPPN